MRANGWPVKKYAMAILTVLLNGFDFPGLQERSDKSTLYLLTQACNQTGVDWLRAFGLHRLLPCNIVFFLFATQEKSMKTHFRLLPCALVLACSASLSMAQTSNRSSTMGERSSFIPYTQQGYVGLSAGQSKYSLNSGTGGFNFDDTGNAAKIYAGGYFNPNFGMEFGYLNFGKGHRLGGTTKAQGFNLSLVGRVPLNEQFDVFGKVGTTYARTRTSGFSGLGVQTGKDNGFGLSYGLGARWSFSPQWAAVVEWERHRLHFADGNSNTNMTTVGVQYRY